MTWDILKEEEYDITNINERPEIVKLIIEYLDDNGSDIVFLKLFEELVYTEISYDKRKKIWFVEIFGEKDEEGFRKYLKDSRIVEQKFIFDFIGNKFHNLLLNYVGDNKKYKKVVSRLHNAKTINHLLTILKNYHY